MDGEQTGKDIFVDTLIANVTAVTMNPKMEVIFGAYIGIEKGKIASIDRTPPKQPPKTVIDGTGMAAIPTWPPRCCAASPTI